MKRKWLIWAAAVVGVAVVAGAGFLARGIWELEYAEQQLHAVGYVEETCAEYIEAHHEWPRSWQDLAEVAPRVGPVEMPRDLEMVRERVHVDFQARVDGIAREGPGTFSGFAPNGRVYYDYSNAYQSVIDAAKKAVAGK